MIIELNRVYTFSAPKAAQGITSGADEFLSGEFSYVPYVSMNKVHNSYVDKKVVKVLGKVFELKGMDMQCVVYYIDLPEKMVRKKINDTIDRYVKNASEKKK